MRAAHWLKYRLNLFIKGAALWSRSKANEALDNLLLESKIMNASRDIGIECSTFDECVAKWIENLQFVRVPSEFLAEQYPTLAHFFV